MKKQKLGKYLLRTLFFVPLILAFVGMRLLNEGPVLDCLYKSVQIYLMEYNVDAYPTNWMVELARWTGPVAAGAAILSMLLEFFERVKVWLKTRNMSSVAVHGNSENKNYILEHLGQKGIDSEVEESYLAKRHILIFEHDSDMYRFLEDNSGELLKNKEQKVYLCSENARRGYYENQQIVVCNIAENCARKYWDVYPIRDKSEKILIIGFGNYGERILTQGLMENVIALDSNIEYHVIGDYKKYLSIHKKLTKIAHVKIRQEDGTVKDYAPYNPICDNHDTIIFYDTPWYDALPEDDVYDRVILCQDEDVKNMDILNELLQINCFSEYHIKFSDPEILKSLWNIEKEKIYTFGTQSELYDTDLILQETLLRQAKIINARYFMEYSCKAACPHRENGMETRELLRKCANCPEHLKDWNGMSSFTRYSNVAQADHVYGKVRLLLGMDVDITDPELGKKAYDAYMRLEEAQQVDLWHLEHIRWNRYHFMNNWDYAPVRDNANRKHHLLVSYDELAYDQQKKDGDAYESLLDIL